VTNGGKLADLSPDELDRMLEAVTPQQQHALFVTRVRGLDAATHRCRLSSGRRFLDARHRLTPTALPRPRRGFFFARCRSEGRTAGRSGTVDNRKALTE
jgi:hypothetical protein